MSKKVKLIVVSVFIVLLGFIRDYFFYNINWIYLTLTINRPNQALKEFHFLLTWTPTQIETLKWVLTVFFVLLFYALTYWVIRMAFNNKIYNRITTFLFIAIFVVSGFLYVIDYLLGENIQLYGIVRTLMGMAQSFIPLMIIFILFKFLPDKK